MSLSDQLLGAMAEYGLPVLGCGLAVAAVGIPLPASLMLIAAGSFVDHGEMGLAAVLIVATLSTIAGDQGGYLIGRWGGRRLARRMSGWIGGEQRLIDAENHSRRLGAMSIFLTRWLFTPLGPWVNIATGIARYPWPQFFLWDALGELCWVVLYVLLGKIFSHEVQTLASLLGDITWSALALLTAVVLAWALYRLVKSRTNAGAVTAAVPRSARPVA